MTLKSIQAKPQQDPGLVELFKGSKRSYEEDVDDLITQLDQSAAYTRAHRNHTKGQPTAQAVGILADGSKIVVHKFLSSASTKLSSGSGKVLNLPPLTATPSKADSPAKAKDKSKAH